ncbi:hypothetical protein ACFWY9_37425 [Amycolatopsis sp. NPDC059027]|uniref:hypothetical protein n=1 Tax=Amycolatopsis sp. NPDC059027 TaxID=3346709 RepID=UPI0036712D5D
MNVRDGLSWVVGPWDEVEVTETGSTPRCPPVLELSGGPGVLTLWPPTDPRRWMECVVFLRQLRDCAEDLATLLENRAAEMRRVSNGDVEEEA